MRSLTQDAPERVRSVSGLITSGGTITTGIGFSVVKGTTGNFTIYPRPRFRYFMDVEASLTAGGFVVVSWSAPNGDSFLVTTYATNAAPADISFLFSARGVAL